MARIRTIKPEFPQSESMGRVSRDARLLFVELWTVADDAGRFRAHPRLLATQLFPYDDDAVALLPRWLEELRREGAVELYRVGQDSYGHIPNWPKHQKIDRPSPSRLPAPPVVASAHEDSSSAREDSCGDLDLDRDLDQDLPPPASSAGPTALALEQRPVEEEVEVSSRACWEALQRMRERRGMARELHPPRGFEAWHDGALAEGFIPSELGDAYGLYLDDEDFRPKGWPTAIFIRPKVWRQRTRAPPARDSLTGVARRARS